MAAELKMSIGSTILGWITGEARVERFHARPATFWERVLPSGTFPVRLPN
jgi:hypothetical protein